MRDTTVFASLLGLTDGWVVTSVDLQLEVHSIRLVVERRGEVVCPVCSKVCPVYDHAEERVWRHLDTMKFMTFVACRVPRSNCPAHGVRQLEVPWAGVKSRFTAEFECIAIELLTMTRCQARTAKILRLSAGQVRHIMHRAVQRGLSRRDLGAIAHIAMDEKSFQRGHVYGCVLSDSSSRRVVNVSLGRDEAAARLVLQSLAQPDAVKTITLDMYEAFKNAAYAELPNAEVIHDRFHVAMNLNKAVDITRRAEQKKRPELKYSRYVWLKNPESRSPQQRADFNFLIEQELQTGRAYAFKEVFRHFFEQEDVPTATEFLNDWLTEVRKAKLPALASVADMLERNFGGLLAYVKWKLTNGFAEGLNAMIQEIKTVARGFRRFENFRIAIMFFLGKLDLYPLKCS